MKVLLIVPSAMLFMASFLKELLSQACSSANFTLIGDDDSVIKGEREEGFARCVLFLEICGPKGFEKTMYTMAKWKVRSVRETFPHLPLVVVFCLDGAWIENDKDPRFHEICGEKVTKLFAMNQSSLSDQLVSALFPE
jgi:hypothetical protein